MKKLVMITAVAGLILAVSGMAGANSPPPQAPVRVSLGSGSFTPSSTPDDGTPEWVVATSAGYAQGYVWPAEQVQYPVGYTYRIEVLGFTPLPPIADTHDWAHLPNYHGVKLSAVDRRWYNVKGFAYQDLETTDPTDFVGMRHESNSPWEEHVLDQNYHISDLGAKFDLRFEFYQTVVDGEVTQNLYYRPDSTGSWITWPGGWQTANSGDTLELSPNGAPSMVVFGGAGTATWDEYAYTTVPEPLTMCLLGLGGIGLLLRRRSRKA